MEHCSEGQDNSGRNNVEHPSLLQLLTPLQLYPRTGTHPHSPSATDTGCHVGWTISEDGGQRRIITAPSLMFTDYSHLWEGPPAHPSSDPAAFSSPLSLQVPGTTRSPDPSPSTPSLTQMPNQAKSRVSTALLYKANHPSPFQTILSLPFITNKGHRGIFINKKAPLLQSALKKREFINDNLYQPCPDHSCRQGFFCHQQSLKAEKSCPGDSLGAQKFLYVSYCRCCLFLY